MTTSTDFQMSPAQIEAYRRDGYYKAEGLFTSDEVQELGDGMNGIIDEWWGEDSIGWRGPWRDHYLPEGEQQKTCAVFLSNPQYYSAAWGRVLFHQGLNDAVRSFVGPAVQWHHSVLHAKPPERGTPPPAREGKRQEKQ